MGKNLFDDSDGDDVQQFELNTNDKYAKTYNDLRKKELLQKFKDKGLTKDIAYLSNDGESSDSSSSDEEEALDKDFDQKFLKTLACIKSKDPSIYDKNAQFFDDTLPGEGLSNDNAKECKKVKPVTLKDYERKIILNNKGKFEDDTDEDLIGKKKRATSPCFAEKEKRLKEEFKKVIDQDDSEEEEFGCIFRKREKTATENENEAADYLQWLAGEQVAIGENEKEQLKSLKQYWSSDQLPKSEQFLRDYILNKGYERAKNYNEIPTYEEIVEDNTNLSEDENDLETQAEFEYKYNFRFEEPDPDFIKRYPRTVEASVRRTDDKRKQKRQDIKRRKQQEKEQKMRELQLVKELKRQEIEEKIRKLKLVTGNEALAFNVDELEEDFDSVEHDKRMNELFNDEYYRIDEGDEKPACPSDIEELKVEDWDNYNPEKIYEDDLDYNYEPHCEDEDFNMDCEFDPVKAKEQLQQKLIENTKRRKGRKGRRNHFLEMIRAEKPIFNPEDEKTYSEYIDEYYKLDCEDIIGDIPCRFKYVETIPNDFGLTIEEILLAKNKELNQWVSLKKAVQIRPDHIEKKEQRLYKLKAKNMELKRKILKSVYGNESDEEDKIDEIGKHKLIDDLETQHKTTIQSETQTNKNQKVNVTNDLKSLQRKSKRKLEMDHASEEDPCQQIIKKINKNSNCEPTGHKSRQLIVENPFKNNKLLKPKAVKRNSIKQLPLIKKQNKKKQIKQNKDNIQDQQANNIAEHSLVEYQNNKIANNGKNSIKINERNKNTINKMSKPKSNVQLKINGDIGKNTIRLKKKGKQQNAKNTNTDIRQISDDRLKAYGINPKKFHKKRIFNNKSK